MRLEGGTSGGLSKAYLVLKELVTHEADDEARLAHRRVPQENQLEMADPVRCHGAGPCTTKHGNVRPAIRVPHKGAVAYWSSTMNLPERHKSSIRDGPNPRTEAGKGILNSCKRLAPG
jgi:hypothetical protein